MSNDLRPVGDSIAKLSRVPRPRGLRSPALLRRLGNAAAARADEDPEIAFQHSLCCQVSFPFDDPGATTWYRRNGNVHLEMTAGSVLHETEGFIPIGLPYGVAPRLLMVWLNTEAMRIGDPAIPTGASFTAFVKGLGLDTNGRTIKRLKDQFSRLTSASMRMGVIDNGRAVTVQTHLVDVLAAAQLTMTPKGRILWPDYIKLSQPYWDSLQSRRAVPLRLLALRALSHSALCIDLYCYLAQRLHRLTPGRPFTVYWPTLHEQFGGGYARLTDFRRELRDALTLVLNQYPEARVADSRAGLVLAHSAPAVESSQIPVKALTSG